MYMLKIICCIQENGIDFCTGLMILFIYRKYSRRKLFSIINTIFMNGDAVHRQNLAKFIKEAPLNFIQYKYIEQLFIIK